KHVPSESMEPMGAHLARIRGDDYYPIGFLFNEGAFRARSGSGGPLNNFTVGKAPPGWWEAQFAGLGQNILFAPTKTLTTSRTMRSIGALFMPENPGNFSTTSSLADSYSGVIYVGKTSAERGLR